MHDDRGDHLVHVAKAVDATELLHGATVARLLPQRLKSLRTRSVIITFSARSLGSERSRSAAAASASAVSLMARSRALDGPGNKAVTLAF